MRRFALPLAIGLAGLALCFAFAKRPRASELILPVEPPPLPEPDATRMKRIVDTLASADYQGRASGTEGQVKAAAFIAKRFQEARISPWAGPGMGGPTPYHWAFSFLSGGRTLHATDIVATIPGEDPVLKNEIVLLSAHHDHLGLLRGVLYPGADDNASGTAGLLEVATLLKDCHPRRTLVFLSVSGEEFGLWGSLKFTEHPPLDLSKVVADLNTDMISRGQPQQLHVAPAHIDGAVTTLVGHARTLARRRGWALADGTDMYWESSDHYSFAKRGIPTLFFFAGMHADYHQPTDTPDKTDYVKMAAVVRLTRDLAWVTANAPQRPEVLPRRRWSGWSWATYDIRPPDNPAHPEEGLDGGQR